MPPTLTEVLWFLPIVEFELKVAGELVTHCDKSRNCDRPSNRASGRSPQRTAPADTFWPVAWREASQLAIANTTVRESGPR